MMNRRPKEWMTWLVFLSGLAWMELAPPLAAQAPSADDLEFFEKRIRPLLVENCHQCHGSQKQKGDLRLDSRASLLKGGDLGPAAVPGRAEASLLIKAICYEDEALRMPPRGKLQPAQIADLTRWIERGLPWPEAAATTGPPASAAFNMAERRRHWCWQPLLHPKAPSAPGSQSPIDAFILDRLDIAGISPARQADKRALLRRVTFDLIGLPPSPAEIESFMADDRPDAYVRVVDRLLASPHYGERWGRHWLDLVRYAETLGHEFDVEIPEAYRYRDYVIRALNADVPYDQFVREHVAGDLLPAPRTDPDGANASIQGTAFWFLGESKHSPVDVRADEADRLDNQIDVFSKTFLGLTVACARCHDHKFDAISTQDYYALTSYLLSSHQQMAFVEPAHDSDLAISRLHDVRERLRCKLAPKQATASKEVGQGDIPSSAVVFEDFSKPGFDGWYVSGQAFGQGPTQALTPVLHIEGAPRASVVPAGVVHSGLLSDKLEGALRSRTFAISKRYIWLHVGGKGGKVSLIIDGYQLIQEPIYGGLRLTTNSGENLTWRVIDTQMWQGHRAYLELSDDGPGYLSIDRIVFADQTAPAGQNRASVEPSIPKEILAELALAKREAEAKLPRAKHIPALEAGTPWDAHVHLRGNPKILGAAAPAHLLEALTDAARPGSTITREDLAHRLVTDARHLLARVMVNRLWQHHMGEGLVRSPDNFGALGEPPTHPELLDYLAGEFIRSGWSIKQLQRRLVLTDVYRRASEPDAQALFKDPQNRLLHFQTLRRLEAECVRDSLLAVSGRLDSRMYGSSVPPYLTAHMAGRGRPAASGPLDGAGRRSIYLNVRRNFLSPLLLAFDYPTPFTTIGRRMSSNVPAQALILMNHPFVLEQAAYWADRALANSGRNSQERIENLYVEAFGRPPTPQERQAAEAFLAEQSGAGVRHDERAAWTGLCHVLFNVKEFIFVR
jgi:Protein of unknown function (DUF1553)/Protein of unknown function (DUF1549)/Planctomycete cytochrome C